MIREVVESIGNALGDGWHVDPAQTYDRDVVLLGPRGERLRFHADDWRGVTGRRRLTIGGQFPPDLQDGPTIGNSGIEVDARRPAAHLASDITRRLLGRYREAVSVARCLRIAALADARVRDAAAHRIALALADGVTGDGVTTWPDHHGGVVVRRGDLDTPPQARFVVPGGARRVDVTLTVPVDVAVAVAELIGRVSR